MRLARDARARLVEHTRGCASCLIDAGELGDVPLSPSCLVARRLFAVLTHAALAIPVEAAPVLASAACEAD